MRGMSFTRGAFPRLPRARSRSTYVPGRRGRLDGGLRVALELAAGGVDIEAARLAHEAGKSAADDVLEAGDALGKRRGVGDSRPGIEGDQVDFGVEVGEQFDLSLI